ASGEGTTPVCRRATLALQLICVTTISMIRNHVAPAAFRGVAPLTNARPQECGAAIKKKNPGGRHRDQSSLSKRPDGPWSAGRGACAAGSRAIESQDNDA